MTVTEVFIGWNITESRKGQKEDIQNEGLMSNGISFKQISKAVDRQRKKLRRETKEPRKQVETRTRVMRSFQRGVKKPVVVNEKVKGRY